MTTHHLLRALDEAVEQVRLVTSRAETPNPAVASYLFDQARAAYELLPEPVRTVCWLRGVTRTR